MASMGARKRADDTTYWRVQFRIDGKACQENFDDPNAAEEFRDWCDRMGPEAARRLRDARTGTPNGTRVPTLAAWLEHHLQHATGTTPGTRAEYRRLAARTWLPALGPLPLDTITRDDIRRWVGAQAQTLTNRGTPTSPKTIANAHGLLSGVMAEAIDAGHRPDNPCRGVRLPDGHRDEMVILTPSEYAQLVDAIPEYWRPLVAFLAGTGMRWGEVTALRWGDVDLEGPDPIARVTRAWKRGETTRELGAPKTKRSRREVNISDAAVQLLPKRRGRDDLVFIGPQGGAVHHQAFHPRVWLPAVAQLAGDTIVKDKDGKPVEKNGKPVVLQGPGKRPRIHDLRHYAASTMLHDGVPITEVQRQLGHESITTTVDRYGHMMPGSRQRVREALNKGLALAFPEVEDGPPALTT